MTEVKNIIFDYGQVIINLDFDLTIKSFEQAGVKDFSSLFTQWQQLPFFDAFDRGLISSEAFRNAIREMGGSHLTDEVIDKCWNAMLLDIPKHRIDFLKKLKSEYNTFLLSNTNFIHLEFIASYLQKTYGIKGIEDYFKKTYYSCNTGMRKPEPGIFQLVMNENNLLPEETLFIDDMEKNTNAAAELGIQTIFLKPGEEVEEAVNRYLKRLA